jgi:hypothetical protein
LRGFVHILARAVKLAERVNIELTRADIAILGKVEVLERADRQAMDLRYCFY